MFAILPQIEQQSLYDGWDYTLNVLRNRAVAETDIPNGDEPQHEIPYRTWLDGSRKGIYNIPLCATNTSRNHLE